MWCLLRVNTHTETGRFKDMFLRKSYSSFESSNLSLIFELKQAEKRNAERLEQDKKASLF